MTRRSLVVSLAAAVLLRPTLALAQPPVGAPAVAAPTALAVAGAVTTPLTLSAADLKAMPRTKIEAQDDNRTVTYEGVLVGELLKRAGVPVGEALRGDASLCDLAGGPEHGRLAITLDPKDGGPIYQGIVGLEATSIARLFEHYLATSEQIASRMLLATTPERAVGLLLQRMPEAAGTTATAWAHAAAAADLATADLLLAAPTPAGLLAEVFPADDLRLFRVQPAGFACRCSSERVANALRLIGRAEVESILAEHVAVSVHCEFCNRRYAFDAAAARMLFAADDGQSTAELPAAPH